MNDFAKQIEKNIRKGSKRKSGKQVFEEYLFFISEGTNNSVESLLMLPTPLVLSLGRSLGNLNKQKNKANKRK